MESTICEITFFVREDGKISSRSNFDSKFFNSNKETANKVLEGLHYDFLYRMKEEKLVNYEIKKDA